MVQGVTRYLIFFLSLLIMLPLPAQSVLSTRKLIPEFQQITEWVGAETPITRKSLSGKLIVLCFWSPTNIQSIQQIQVLTQWQHTYKVSAPFEVISIAIPEFEFQKNPTAQTAAINDFHLPFPAGLDPNFFLYNTYGITSLPALFLIDDQGAIRESYAGNFQYSVIEDRIRQLIVETPTGGDIPFIEKVKLPEFKSYPEIFFGYRKLLAYGNYEKPQAERESLFSYPEREEIFQFYLKGQWHLGEESFQVLTPPSAVKIPFQASSAGIVAGTSRRGLTPVEVRLDGLPLTKKNKGKDIVLQEGKSYVFVKNFRYYKLVNLRKKTGNHILELISEEPGIEIFKAGFS